MSELGKMLYSEASREIGAITKISLILGLNWSRRALLNFRRQVLLKQLQEEYNSIVECKEKRFCRKDQYRTEFELKFERLLRKEMKIQFLKQFWIGDSCFDFFIPGVCGKPGGKRMKGLVIEIDGGVHSLELKMKKDETKGELLQRLEIGHYSISNEKVNNKTIQEIAKLLRTSQSLDFRGKQRVLRVAYLVTIIADFRNSLKKSRN
jgi:very-short-patch-repair endonuclease